MYTISGLFVAVQIHILVWFEGANVPEDNTASISFHYDGHSMFLGNTDTQLLEYMVSCLRAPQYES